MKNTRVILLLFIFFVCFQTSAKDSEERKLSAFHNISVVDGITVVLIPSDKNKAVVTADGIPLSDVVTDLSVFSLTVKLKNYVPKASVSVEIYYIDELDAITTESGVTVLSDGKVYADKLNINARFGGVIRIEIQAKEVEIQAAGATVTLTGNTSKLNVYALKDAFVDCSSLVYTSQKKFVSDNGIVKLKEQ